MWKKEKLLVQAISPFPTMFLTLSQMTILDSSKLKELADNNFEFHANGSKFSKQVENTVGRGETARYEQFLLFPQCFQKSCFPGVSKGVTVGNGLKDLFHRLVKRCHCVRMG